MNSHSQSGDNRAPESVRDGKIKVGACQILTTEDVQKSAEKVMEKLIHAAKQGIEILSCGTCLDYYKLKDKLRVGIESNMLEIVSFMADADRVLRP